MTDRTIGIIGVGLMGLGIATNIARKGWKVNFLHHEGNQPVADLEALGASGFDDRQDLARASDVMILCLNGSPQVEAVLLGAGGVLEALRPGSVVIDCSTAIPASTEAIGAKVAAAGSRFMDAAMTRTPLEAAEGRLNLLIGADPALYAEMEPLLETFSENRFHAGGVGAGNTLKLLHNFVSLGSVLLISEAAACASASGIAPEVLVDVLKKGGGYGAGLDRVSPYLLEGDTSKLRFSVANAHKDLSYYGQLAADQGASAGVATGVLTALEGLMKAGHSARFLSETSSLLGDASSKS